MHALPFFISVGIILTVGLRAANSQQLPNLQVVGAKEWRSNKGAPLSTISLTDESRGARLAITPFGAEFPTITSLKKGPQGGRVQHFYLYFGSVFSPASAHYDPNGLCFEAIEGGVIPFFGELYKVEEARQGSVGLRRVTDLVPKHLVPKPRSRVITLSSLDATLFWEPVPGRPDASEFDIIRISSFSEDQRSAKIEIEPRVVSRVPYNSLRKPLTLTVSKGGKLSARSRAYEVIDVVPNQKIDGVGDLVGWIEIASEESKMDSEEIKGSGGEIKGSKK